MRTLTLAGAFLVVLPVAAAQNDFKAIFGRHWQISKEFTLAVAESMPPDGYDFKPNPEQMSFGQLMIHIADENSRSFARAAGTKPLAKPTVADKQTAIRFLTESFDWCARELEAMTPEQLDNVAWRFQGRPILAWEGMWWAFTMTAHHRGQAEVYLRVKNIKPPAYQF
jgi:uncharacterized damage-inducible protein DinB